MRFTPFVPLQHALFAGALALACAGGHAQALVDTRPLVRLAPLVRASVDGERVSLRDVVSVEQDDAQVAARVLDLDLGPSPRVGQPAHLQRAQLEERLRMFRLGGSVRVEWSGPAQVDVERASQLLSGQDLDDVARPFLDAWLARRSESHALEAIDPVDTLAVPTGRVTLQARALPRVDLPTTRASVWIDVCVGGHFERSVKMDYRVQAFKTGWIAAEELEHGQVLTPARLQRAQVDVAQLTGALWTDAPDNARMRRSVHRGDALTMLDVETRPWVARGERVEISSRMGELSIEAQGEALQDGRAGQDVLVRIATSRTPVVARVLKPGLVEIRQ